MAVIDSIKSWGHDLLGMLFPNVCEVCGCALARTEHLLCLKCRYEMPRTNIHNDPFNHIHRQLAGHAPIERAAGYFYYYRDNPYAKLIHSAKYNGRPNIARTLASDYAMEILSDRFFDGMDFIIPVPLHRIKRMQRGYNQSYYIAQGISDITGIPIADNLIAKRHHETQTRRNAYARWLNARNSYGITRPEELKGKHMLIVDDVITTGATLSACCESIHETVPDARLSVLTLAVAHLS